MCLHQRKINFIYSHHLPTWQSIDKVGRNIMFIILTKELLISYLYTETTLGVACGSTICNHSSPFFTLFALQTEEKPAVVVTGLTRTVRVWRARTRLHDLIVFTDTSVALWTFRSIMFIWKCTVGASLAARIWNKCSWNTTHSRRIYCLWREQK